MRREFYRVGAELEEEKGLNQKLTAQVNLDFENSSIPSSQQKPGRKKIPNSRVKTDRKPGGQPGHYIPTGIYAEIRSLSNLRFQTQLYRDLKAASGRMVLKVAPLPENIVKLGVEGVNQIWRNAKLRGAGMKRAKTLVSAAEHSIGSKEAPEAARVELKNLLNDMDIYASRQEELLLSIEEKLKEIPYIDKLMAIKGIGLITVSGFIAEVGDIGRFNNPKQLQKLAGYAIVVNESDKHNGESRISYRGRKRLRYVLYEAVISLIGKNAEFWEINKYYRNRKENPLKKMQSA